MAAVPAATQMVRMRAFFVDVPAAQHDECIQLALEGAMELAGLAALGAPLAPALAENALAMYFMPGAVPAPMPAPLRNHFQELLVVFVPRAIRVAGPIPVAGAAAAPIVVETEANRERNITLMWLGPAADAAGAVLKRTRVPRDPPNPYSALYPQKWLPEANRLTAFANWEAQLLHIVNIDKDAEMHKTRHTHLLQMMLCWFEMLPVGVTPETLPLPNQRAFFHIIEQFLELAILQSRLASPPAVATAHFHAACLLTWHKSEPLDYFSALNAAKVVKGTFPADDKNTDPRLFSRGGGGARGRQ